MPLTIKGSIPRLYRWWIWSRSSKATCSKVRFQIWATGHDNTCFRVVFREEREKWSQNIVFFVKIGENGNRKSWEPVMDTVEYAHFWHSKGFREVIFKDINLRFGLYVHHTYFRYIFRFCCWTFGIFLISWKVKKIVLINIFSKNQNVEIAVDSTVHSESFLMQQLT